MALFVAIAPGMLKVRLHKIGINGQIMFVCLHAFHKIVTCYINFNFFSFTFLKRFQFFIFKTLLNSFLFQNFFNHFLKMFSIFDLRNSFFFSKMFSVIFFFPNFFLFF
jgi:hypothetical protein